MKNAFEELRAKIRATIAKVDGLTIEAKIKKNNDIKEMILYYNNLTKDTEERRIKIHYHNLQLSVILLAGVGLIIGQWNNLYNEIKPFLIAPMIIQFISIIVAIYYFERQSKFPYIFKSENEFGNRWKWFYYGNTSIQNIDRSILKYSKNSDKTLKPFLEGYDYFLQMYLNEDIDTEIKNNLQQLYLLQVHDYYKNRFYLQLVTIRITSIITSVVIEMLLLILYLLSR